MEVSRAWEQRGPGGGAGWLLKRFGVCGLDVMREGGQTHQGTGAVGEELPGFRRGGGGLLGPIFPPRQVRVRLKEPFARMHAVTTNQRAKASELGDATELCVDWLRTLSHVHAEIYASSLPVYL
jgi:hypothetical protein